MKVKLLLKVRTFEFVDDTPLGIIEREDNELILSLIVDEKREFILHRTDFIDDKEMYFEKLEELINESTIIINAIPGLKLIVDQSVCEFIEGEEEEIRKFVSMLVTEM